MGRGDKTGGLQAAALRDLLTRAGVTLREAAKAAGLAGPSSFQKYVNPTRQSPLPLWVVQIAEPLLVNRGTPPITREEIWERLGNIPAPAIGAAPSNPKVYSAAVKIAETMGFKMKDPQTGEIIDCLTILQRLGHPDLSTEDAAKAIKRIKDIVDQIR